MPRELSPGEIGTPLLLPTKADDEVSCSESFSRWLRLGVAWFGCVLCGGILPGQALFTQEFVEAGVFAHLCTEGVGCPEQYLVIANLFSVLSCVALVAFLPAGLIFDAVGARITGLTGATILIFGLMLLYTSLLFTWGQVVLFPVAVILVDMGSMINSMCLFGFLFHLPEWNGLLLSLSNNCYYVSAMLPVILRYLVDKNYVASFVAALFWYGVCVLLFAIPAFWLALPSQTEYYRMAQKVVGMPMPRPPNRGGAGSFVEFLRRVWRRARMGRQVSLASRSIFQRSRVPEHGFMLASSVAGYLGTFVYSSMPTPFGEELFNSPSAGKQLATLMATNLSLLGLFVGPLAGVGMDRAGAMTPLFLANVVSLLAAAICTPYASWEMQVLAASFVNFFLVTNVTMLMKYILAFAAPTRLGTVTGLFTAFFSLLAIPFMGAFSAVISLMGNDPQYPAREYIAPSVVMDCAGAVLFFAFWWILELPTEPPLLPEDETELSHRFMVSSLADAVEVLDLPRGELLRLSASSKPLDMRALALRTAESSGRLHALAQRKVASMDMSAIRRPPVERNLGGGWQVTDRTQPLDLVDGFVQDAFWPPQDANYSGSKLFTQYMSSGMQRGGITEHESVSAILALQSTQHASGYHLVNAFGHLLELWCDGQLAALLFAMPPGLNAGIGSNEYFLGIAKSQGFEMPDLPSLQQKMMEMDGCMTVNKPTKPHWYVQILATGGAHRGRGCATKLLHIVREWAQRDGVSTYLETDADTAPFYEKVGFRRIWSEWLEGSGPEDSIEVVGLMWY